MESSNSTKTQRGREGEDLSPRRKERGDELHLFEGVPAGWCAPGMRTQLNGITTTFGELTCELRVNADGSRLLFSSEPLTERTCAAIELHTAAWSGKTGGVVRLEPHRRYVNLDVMDRR